MIRLFFFLLPIAGISQQSASLYFGGGLSTFNDRIAESVPAGTVGIEVSDDGGFILSASYSSFGRSRPGDDLQLHLVQFALMYSLPIGPVTPAIGGAYNLNTARADIDASDRPASFMGIKACLYIPIDQVGAIRLEYQRAIGAAYEGEKTHPSGLFIGTTIRL